MIAVLVRLLAGTGSAKEFTKLVLLARQIAVLVLPFAGTVSVL